MVPTTQRPDLSRLLIPIFQCRSPFDHTRSNQSLRPLRHLVRRSDSVATGAKADMTRMRQFGRLRPKADIHRQERLGD